MLFNEEKSIIQGDGSLKAKLVLVDGFPTQKDIYNGKPLSSIAGGLFIDLLNTVGITRYSCYITNVIKESVKDAKASDFISINNRGEAVHESEAFKNYKLGLKRELEKTSANLIIAIGDIATYALCGFKFPKSSKRRGSIYESTLLPGRKVLVVLSPASALRNYDFRNFILNDLIKAKKELEYPELRIRKREYSLLPSFTEIEDFLLKLKKDKKPVAFDIEVIRNEISHISFSNDSSFAMSIAFVENGKNKFPAYRETIIWNLIASILQDYEIKKVLQNALFDIPYIFRKTHIETRGDIWDTMIAQAFIYPDFPKGLDFLCSMYTDMPYYKDEGKQHMKQLTDDENFSLYSAKDSIVLLEIMEEQIKELEKQGNLEYTKNHMKLIHPLAYMSERGIRLDTEGLKKMAEQATIDIVELTEKFQELTGIEGINPSSSKQVMNYFYINRGIKPYKNRSTGNPTIDDNALQRIIRKYNFQEAIVLREYRKLSKLKSTYYDMNYDKDNRIRCSWNAVGTRYSRLSSSKNIHGTGTNLQNQPHSMKKYFLADEDYLVFSIDLSQADWRIVAYLSQDERMISALENKLDIHRVTASFIFNKPPDEISNEDGSASFGNGTQSERFWGKKANHAFNYGQSANAFALQMLISQKEAKEIQHKYFSGYPNIRNIFWAEIERDLRRTRTIRNLFERAYTFFGRYDNNLLNAAYAYIPQSTVADIVNQWGLIPIYYDPELSDIELLQQVHDSISFQIPLRLGFNKISYLLKRIYDNLTQPLEYKGSKFTIPCEGEFGFNFKDTYEIDFNNIERSLRDGMDRINK